MVKFFDSLAFRNWSLTALRVGVGTMFFVHGWQKLFVSGLGATAGSYGEIGVPAPALAAFVVAAVQLVGGLALILGFWTRRAATVMTLVALAATIVRVPNGFFLPDGFEYVLLLFLATLALCTHGAGAAAWDARGPRSSSESTGENAHRRAA